MIKRVFMIGAGFIAREHAKAAYSLPCVPRLFVADPNPEVLASFKSAFPEAKTYSTSAAMLAEPVECGDVAVVATPPGSHFASVMDALRSGRHVLCEKPLAPIETEVVAMVNAAAAAGLHLVCCSNRFSARRITAEVRRVVNSGALGRDLRMLWQFRTRAARAGIEYQPGSRWFLQRSKAVGGCLLDWGCYDIAVWVEVFDPVAILIESAWLGFPKVGVMPEDFVVDVEHQVTASLALMLADGRRIPVLYERCSACHGLEHDISHIEGEHGAVAWDWLDWNGNSMRVSRNGVDGSAVLDKTTISDDQVSLHERPLHSLNSLLCGSAGGVISGAKALACFSTVAAIYRAARTRQLQTIQFSP